MDVTILNTDLDAVSIVDTYGYRTYGDVLDSSDASITDSNLDTVIGRTYSSDLLRDSNGDVIEGRAIFVIK